MSVRLFSLVAAIAVLAASGAAALPQSVVVHSGSAAPAAVREIVDPANGNRWLLVRDQTRPGGPGRLVCVSYQQENRNTVAQPFPAYRPAIHSGDSLVVEQNTPILEARFTAVALETAQVGTQFRVRLKATGAVVHAIALAPGRATMADQAGGLR